MNQQNKCQDYLGIRYSIEVFVDGLESFLFHEKEISIRQFMFTEDEIDEDL
jgi:hypothetical protein